MAGILQKYHNFLQENEIETIHELIIILLRDPYNIHIRSDERYPDLVMLDISDRTILESEITRIFNGLIISKEDIKYIVCYGGEIIDFISEDIANNMFDFKLKNYKFYLGEDSSVIRLFFYDDEWIVSSNKYINTDQENALGSNSISIKDIFESSCRHIHFNYKMLDKKYIYKFSIKHHLNRNVINHTINSLVHHNTYSINTIKEEEINIGLPKRIEVSFKNLSNLLETCKYSKWTTPGFIIKNIENGKQYKIFTNAFLYVQLLRGYETECMERFFILNSEDLNSEYLKYFPEETRLYNTMKIMMSKFIDYFYKSYVDLKILKIYKEEYKYIIYEKEIINEIHIIYLSSGINTSVDLVSTIIKNFEPKKLKEIFDDPTIAL